LVRLLNRWFGCLLLNLKVKAYINGEGMNQSITRSQKGHRKKHFYFAQSTNFAQMRCEKVVFPNEMWKKTE